MTKQARAARLQAPNTNKRSHLLTVKSPVSQGTVFHEAHHMHHMQHQAWLKMQYAVSRRRGPAKWSREPAKEMTHERTSLPPPLAWSELVMGRLGSRWSAD